MGERKANTDSQRLLLRLEWPRDQVMVVGVNLERDFLQRADSNLREDPAHNAWPGKGHYRECLLPLYFHSQRGTHSAAARDGEGQGMESAELPLDSD